MFEVILADGSIYMARRVVCAMGPGPAFQGMRAILPWWAEELEEALEADDEYKHDATALTDTTGTPPFKLLHSSALNQWLVRTEA